MLGHVTSPFNYRESSIARYEWTSSSELDLCLPLPKTKDGECVMVGLAKEYRHLFTLQREKGCSRHATTSVGSSKKQESSRKTFISALLTMPKPLTMWITTNCGKFLKRWEYQATWPASQEICMEASVKTGHGTTDWFQIGKRSMSRLYIVTLLI